MTEPSTVDVPVGRVGLQPDWLPGPALGRDHWLLVGKDRFWHGWLHDLGSPKGRVIPLVGSAVSQAGCLLVSGGLSAGANPLASGAGDMRIQGLVLTCWWVRLGPRMADCFVLESWK